MFVFRQDLIVSIPLHEENFKKLPMELQNGFEVPIYPVVFNVGINEHATIAERFVLGIVNLELILSHF